jgi:hypothetical protein
MGTGTNVQRRLVALHHLDAPWRPRDIEQREGRILRQGNLNPEVEIYRYVTEGSFDAYMWQTLETKARFIQQVMSGATSVRSAEDLEGGALTYAEIKAIASGNPAVMEKVKVDTEIRKLDQLRAVHLNQQHSIRWQIRTLPQQIAEGRLTLRRLHEDITTRDANTGDSFTMSVGRRVFSGKGAREQAATALTEAVLSSRDDGALQAHARFRGFEILSRDKPGVTGPEIFIRGSGTYAANFNAENPIGTIQSIEHTLRILDRAADESQEQLARLEKQFADYQGQVNRPFEHEDRIKELLVRQAQLNAALDLDKGDQQAAPPDAGDGEPVPDRFDDDADAPALCRPGSPRAGVAARDARPQLIGVLFETRPGKGRGRAGWRRSHPRSPRPESPSSFMKVCGVLTVALCTSHLTRVLSEPSRRGGTERGGRRASALESPSRKEATQGRVRFDWP